MELNIPDCINYECTGCGKCCSGWSVPLTKDDYDRIASINWQELHPDFKNKNLYRELHTHEKLNTPYSYAINPEPGGQCPFLKNNLCFIHSQLGAEVKPAICKLFPYSFNETPSGVFATVSFISRGAIFNAGRSLLDQKEYLESKYLDFQRLFPNHHPNWSAIKLSSNLSLQWLEYVDIEKEILNLIKKESVAIEDRFIEGSIYLRSLLNDRLQPTDKMSVSLKESIISPSQTREIALNYWDKILLSALSKRYFPHQKKRAKGYGQLSLDLGSFVNASLNSGYFDKLLKETEGVIWDDTNDQINGLIYRFLYSRIFAKLYFGAGFGQLSLIAGFNHLAVVLALLKLKVRQNAKERGEMKIAMEDLVPAIVQLERNLGELRISPYGAAIMEVLLGSQQRIRRILRVS